VSSITPYFLFVIRFLSCFSISLHQLSYRAWL
jgi:hypothetical protein